MRTLPRRDAGARAQLVEAARRVAPVSDARERILAVGPGLGDRLPGGGLRRGTVTSVAGAAGAGATSIVLRLLAAATSAGEWATAVEGDRTLGGLAAIEAGVDPRRFAVVRGCEPAHWPTVVAALVDGMGVVAATVPAGLRAADAQRLVSRTRERQAILVVVESAGIVDRRIGSWPADAALRLVATGARWEPITSMLTEPVIGVEVGGKGAARRTSRVKVARAG